MKRLWSNILAFVIVGVLVFFILKNVDFRELFFYLQFIDPLYILLAIGSCLSYFFIAAFRLKYLTKNLFKVEYFFLLKVLFAGAFFNTVTPGAGIGGEPFKAYYLGKKYNQPKNKFLSILVADKFFHLIVTAFFLVFSIFFVLVYVKISNNLKYLFEGVLIFVFVAFGVTTFLILKKLNFNFGAVFKKLYFFKFIKKRFKNIKDFEKYVNEKINEFSEVFRTLLKSKRNFFVSIFLAFVYWSFEFLASYFVFLSFGFKINILSMIIVVSLGIILGTISITPGGIGFVEGLMVLFYSAMGINLSLALLVAIISRLIYYFFSLFVGGLIFLYLRHKLNGK